MGELCGMYPIHIKLSARLTADILLDTVAEKPEKGNLDISIFVADNISDVGFDFSNGSRYHYTNLVRLSVT